MNDLIAELRDSLETVLGKLIDIAEDGPWAVNGADSDPDVMKARHVLAKAGVLARDIDLVRWYNPNKWPDFAMVIYKNNVSVDECKLLVKHLRTAGLPFQAYAEHVVNGACAYYGQGFAWEVERGEA